METKESIRQMAINSILESDFSHLASEFNKESYIASSKFVLNRSTIQEYRAVLLAKLQKDGFDGTPLMVGKFIPPLGDIMFVIYDSDNMSYQQANDILESLEIV